MNADEVLAAAEAVTGGPVTIVDDLSFSNRAFVARVQLADGSTAIAKRPFEDEGFGNESKALRLLPPETRPGLLGAADGVLLDGGPRHGTVARRPSARPGPGSGGAGSAGVGRHAWIGVARHPAYRPAR